MPETTDLIIRKAVFDDWRDMYENVWRHEETARYMLWDVTNTEEDAMCRIERTIVFQEKTPLAFLICEKTDNRAIGFVGMMETSPGVYEDCGLALGPDFVRKGYGRQVLTALMEETFHTFGAQKIICSCRSENEASRRLQLSCGFCFTHAEQRIDPRNGSQYILEFYEKTR